MKPIVTVTLSPSLDGISRPRSSGRPTRSARRTRFYPAGGGVNVARVITELGGRATPVYCSGGPTGAILDRLLRDIGLVPRPIRIAGDTRVSHAVFERSTGREYRFVPEGPDIGAEEVARVLEEIDALDFDWLVASGSLPASLPAGTFAAIARHATARGARFVLDTSGPAPARRRPRLGRRPPGQAEHRRAARPDRRAARRPTPRSAPRRSACVPPTGWRSSPSPWARTARCSPAPTASAACPRRGCRCRAPPAPVTASSARLVFALAEGRSPDDAFELAIAAGAAAVLTYGTDLCHRQDVLGLLGAPAA